eukprot:gene3581-4461_t
MIRDSDNDTSLSITDDSSDTCSLLEDDCSLSEYLSAEELIQKKERLRQQTVNELVKTETSYVRDLKLIQKLFIEPVKNKITKQEANDVFGCTIELLNLHRDILAELEKHTPPDYPDYKFIQSSLLKISSVLEEVNERVEIEKKLKELETNLCLEDLKLVNSTRKILKEGLTSKKLDKELLKCFLLTAKNKKSNATVKQIIKLDSMLVRDSIESLPGVTQGFEVLLIDKKDKIFSLFFQTESEKKEWYQMIYSLTNLVADTNYLTKYKCLKDIRSKQSGGPPPPVNLKLSEIFNKKFQEANGETSISVSDSHIPTSTQNKDSTTGNSTSTTPTNNNGSPAPSSLNFSRASSVPSFNNLSGDELKPNPKKMPPTIGPLIFTNHVNDDMDDLVSSASSTSSSHSSSHLSSSNRPPPVPPRNPSPVSDIMANSISPRSNSSSFSSDSSYSSSITNSPHSEIIYSTFPIKNQSHSITRLPPPPPPLTIPNLPPPPPSAPEFMLPLDLPPPDPSLIPTLSPRKSPRTPPPPPPPFIVNNLPPTECPIPIPPRNNTNNSNSSSVPPLATNKLRTFENIFEKNSSSSQTGIYYNLPTPTTPTSINVLKKSMSGEHLPPILPPPPPLVVKRAGPSPPPPPRDYPTTASINNGQTTPTTPTTTFKPPPPPRDYLSQNNNNNSNPTTPTTPPNSTPFSKTSFKPIAPPSSLIPTNNNINTNNSQPPKVIQPITLKPMGNGRAAPPPPLNSTSSHPNAPSKGITI